MTGWKPETVRSSHWKCSVKQGVLKNFPNFTGKILYWSFFINKVAVLEACSLLKKTPKQALSCEIWKHCKSNYFEEHLWISTSKIYLKRDSSMVFSCGFCELFKNTYFVEDLQTAGSETPVWGSLFNKVASFMAWRPLTVLRRDCSTCISLWILWNF